MEQIVYEYPTARFIVYPKYIVAEVHKNIDIYKIEADAMREVAEKHFSGEFGLIDHRLHQISINPDVYRHIQETFSSPKLTAFALVSTFDITRKSYPIEEMFLNRLGIENKFFYTIAPAKEWMESLFKDK